MIARVEYDRLSIADLPKDKSTPVVFYCINERCSASPIAARRARELGWSNVYLMPRVSKIGSLRVCRSKEAHSHAGAAYGIAVRPEIAENCTISETL